MTGFLVITGLFLLAIAGFAVAMWNGDWRPLLACLPLVFFLKAAL